MIPTSRPKLNFHPWCIVRQLPNMQRLVVARFHRRGDAEGYIQIERKKLDLLTVDEIPELAGIIELSQIFTSINAQLSTQAKWCPIALDNLYD